MKSTPDMIDSIGLKITQEARDDRRRLHPAIPPQQGTNRRTEERKTSAWNLVARK